MYTETAQKENSNTATEMAEGVHGGEFGGCVTNGGNLQSADVQESSLPPFLQKIFEIADDPETKSIVSWNSKGTSFIIWDHNKFSEKILPKYFKTTVFSSFVYQLNNYGFRKISCNKHEYRNPWFQAGKKELLKNITRRNKKFQATKKRGCVTLNYDSMNARVEQELQALMTEQNSMKEQIQKLKESLANMEHQITSIQSKTRFPQLSDNQGSGTIFLKQKHPKEIKDPASKNDDKKPRLTELKIRESEVNNQDKIEISTPKVSSAESPGNSIQATKENAESFEFLKRILDDDTWFSREGEGDLPVNHSKAIVDPSIQATKENAESFEFLKRILDDDTWFSREGERDLPVNHSKAIVEPDKMMESYRAMDRGNLKEKA